MHNLTGRTQPNGTSETTISKAYHRRRKPALITRSLASRFMHPLTQKIKLPNVGMPVTCNTVTRNFYWGAQTEPSGTFALNGNFLVLNWNKDFTDSECFEAEFIHLTEIELLK